MGWAHGIDIYGEDVGYGIPDVCWEIGCKVQIDRGLAHHCGGLESPRFGQDSETGCGGFFCGAHFTVGALCYRCGELADARERVDLLERVIGSLRDHDHRDNDVLHDICCEIWASSA